LVDKDIIQKAVEEFNEENGNRKCSTKDLVIFFNKQHDKNIAIIFEKIDHLYSKIEKRHLESIQQIAKQNQVIQHITDELPEKGWCQKIQNVLDCWQPYKKEPPLDIKVQNLWYDRKLIKFLTGALVIAIFASVGSIIVNLVI